MTAEQLELVLAMGSIIVIGIVPPIFMWLSLARQGDERRKMILEKTCTATLTIYTLVMLIDVVGCVFNAELFDPVSSNLVHLAVIGVLFSINFFIMKRKYGN